MPVKQSCTILHAETQRNTSGDDPCTSPALKMINDFFALRFPVDLSAIEVILYYILLSTESIGFF